jgi:hypothetical protein
MYDSAIWISIRDKEKEEEKEERGVHDIVLAYKDGHVVSFRGVESVDVYNICKRVRAPIPERVLREQQEKHRSVIC